MKKIYLIFISLLIIFSACKKRTDENNNSTWTEEDQIFYNNIITLQDKGGENWTTWSKTMDSLEAINKLQQFFLSDPSVTSATIGSQGIAVQYSNGMRGGIFLNPENSHGEDSIIMGPIPKIPYAPLNGKSLVNKKKMIFLSPAYWELSTYSNMMITTFKIYLPKSGFDLTQYENNDATVDRFAQLADHGIIYFDSHGWAWPNKKNIEEVYLLTGEEANDLTTKKYGDDLKKGDIPIVIIDKESRKKNVYWLSSKFITSHNDFSKDTVLFVGGLCYSFLGGWAQIYTKFAKGAYFGFDWGVKYWRCAQWSMSLIDSLCDTLRKPPFNPERWMTGTAIAKSYVDEEGRTVHIKYVGDTTLTLWKSIEIETTPIINITETTATGGGNIKSDGGLPVTERGICWSNLSNPTIANDHTSDGKGNGAFVSNLTGLTPNKQYNVRAYATNNKGTVYGNQLSFSAGTEGTVTDIDGNVYHTVKIGTQVWLVENLKVTHYNNGGEITWSTTDSAWMSMGVLKKGAYCAYNNDPNNAATYGLLYNWFTIAGNMCPTGWHVPTDAEWTALDDYLLFHVGGKMKEAGTTHWASPNTGATNESGFTALPGSGRNYIDFMEPIGEVGYWWSSTAASDPNNAYYRKILYDDDFMYRNVPTWIESGLAVRCIKN